MVLVEDADAVVSSALVPVEDVVSPPDSVPVPTASPPEVESSPVPTASPPLVVSSPTASPPVDESSPEASLVASV